MRNYFNFSLFLTFFVLHIVGCDSYTPDEQTYIEQIEKYREVKDSTMHYDDHSPFNAKSKIEFHPLKYYSIDPLFVFTSRLIEYNVKDTVIIFGTKGGERTAVRFGYLPFTKDQFNYKLNVYENFGRDGSQYYSTWFTDKTTTEDTYGVGRYLKFEYNSNPDFEYTLDFNLAFNPYCAYSANYSCAIPSRKDFINMEITAGEKAYHN